MVAQGNLRTCTNLPGSVLLFSSVRDANLIAKYFIDLISLTAPSPTKGCSFSVGPGPAARLKGEAAVEG